MAVTESAIEAVAEVAEEVAEQAEHVAEVSRVIDGRALGIGLGIGLVGGFAIGGWYINRRLRLKYEEITQAEIEEMRAHFHKRLQVREDKPDLAEAAREISVREGYSSPQTPIIEEEQDGVQAGEPEQAVEEAVVVEDEGKEEAEAASSDEVTSVFESAKEADEGWDFEHELSERLPEKPYVIHFDERHEEQGYTELSLVYYSADDVLCDERDNPVDDKENVVGEKNLEKFGHGSHDKNVVYIRNDVLDLEVEVVKNDGSYAEVVHGFTHSEYGRHQKHRFDDEPGAD